MKPFKEPLYSQSYVDTGTGFPVVLLHGVFGNLTMWRTTINALRANYRVVVPRLPLFDVPIHRATLANLSEILHDFLDWNQLTDVTLVGTDIGAQLALDYSYRHPDRVRKVIISGSNGFQGQSSGARRRYAHVWRGTDAGRGGVSQKRNGQP